MLKKVILTIGVVAGLSAHAAAPAAASAFGQSTTACVNNVADDDRLNLREGPGPQYRVVGSLGSGVCGIEVKFDTCQRTRHGKWCAAIHKGHFGWLNARFLIKESALPSGDNFGAAQFPIGAVTYGGNIRSGPGTRYRVLGTPVNGDSLELFRATGRYYRGYQWFEVTYEDRGGFMWGGVICPKGRSVPGTRGVC